MEALPDQSSFSREARADQDEARYRSGNLILWIAAIAVLVGLNFASWSFCMWVFGQPEHPFNYRLLTKLEKLDPITGFNRVSAPRGKFFSAKELYADVYPFTPTELVAYNGILKRHYLKNYEERDDVVFLSGDFLVESVQRMGESDAFQSGLVIRGQSVDFPDVLIDLALPSEDLPEFFDLKEGDEIRVSESTTCAALLNVDRVENDVMIFTVVPLVTLTFDSPPQPKLFEVAEEASIHLSTPTKIQIEPERWPISKDVESIEEKPISLSPSQSELKPDGEQESVQPTDSEN